MISKDLIKKIRKDKKLTQSEFAVLLGVSRELVGKMERGEEPISKNTVAKLDLLRIKEENLHIKQPKKVAQIQEDSEKEIITIGKHYQLKPFGAPIDEWEGVPMYNLPVSASFVQHYHDETFNQPEFYLRDTRFKDCNFGAIITGDSMHGEIRHSDRVICKELKNLRSLIHGDIYYIVTDELETCKYIHPVIKDIRPGAQRKKDGTYQQVDIIYDDEKLLLVPHNSSVPPSEVFKEDIIKLYKVKGVLRGY